MLARTAFWVGALIISPQVQTTTVAASVPKWCASPVQA